MKQKTCHCDGKDILENQKGSAYRENPMSFVPYAVIASNYLSSLFTLKLEGGEEVSQRRRNVARHDPSTEYGYIWL